MTKNHSKKYTVEKKDNLLIFSTENYAYERDSVLHSGIYNKEFASMLASSVTAGISSIALIIIYGRTILSYIAFILISIALFPLFRKLVFVERQMETVFDLSSGKVQVSLKGLRKKLKDNFLMKDITGIVIEQKKEKTGNPDAVAFVERISLQHGAVIPGFGEEKTFYMLKLRLADSTERMIYADSNMDDVMSVHGELKEFLKI